MNDLINDKPFDLTVAEVSNIWASYLKNSMELRLFEYFHASTEDNDIKKVIEKLLVHSQEDLNELEELFTKNNLNIPIGFNDKDVTIDAHKTFSDTFMLFFCHDITLLSLTNYTSALFDCTRKDVRNYFQVNLEFSLNVQNEITELMLSKGVYSKPSQLAINSELDFVDSKKYLSNLLSDHRSLNAPEITNLTRIIHRAQFSKMVLVAFSKLSNSEKIKKHFSQGRDEMDSVLHTLNGVLEKENIPISASGDFTIYDVEMSPFSDKLMLFFVNTCLGMYCFVMLGQALNSTARSDILLKLSKISTKFRKYYAKGIFLTINENWFEEPPQVVDRKV